jgi:hypothetical protein
MNCAEVRDHLDPYIAGHIEQHQRVVIEEHLAECGECKVDLEAARSLRRVTASLPRSVVPRRSLWDGIESRLAMPPSRSRWSKWVLPIAAALATVALATATWYESPGTGSADAIPAEVQRLIAAYGEAANDLQSALRPDPLGGSTEPVAFTAALPTLETLDLAIAESRSALIRDPDNPALQHLLLSVHRKKVELLRQVATLDAGGEE